MPYKIIVIIITILFSTVICNAQSALMICDDEGDCADVVDNGLVFVDTHTPSNTVGSGSAFMLCDSEMDCADIIDGKLQLN